MVTKTIERDANKLIIGKTSCASLQWEKRIRVVHSMIL